MAVPYIGIGTWVGLGEESSWGVADSRTNWLKAGDGGVSLRKRTIRLPVPELVHGTNYDIQTTYKSREETTGGFGVVARYDGLGLLLKAALGGTPSTSGTASPYTHTFGLGTALPGLTVEKIRGNSGQSEVFSGFTVGSWTLSGAAGEPVRFSCEGIAKTSASRGSAGSPSVAAAEPIIAHQATTVTFDGDAYTLVSFEITGNNNISDLLEVGSDTTSQPPISNFREFRGSVVMNYRADTLWDEHHGGEEGDVVLTFTGATSPNAMTITLQNCIIDDVDDAVGGPGVVQMTVTFLGRAATGADSISVEVVNASASATANGN